ncbi:hypothetical protein GDO78_003381 [Eleutherodactylus coqui]|uniref:Uncharacterized protein n=1 Tax=Eleutherodactylus coqui TaxID=57060 RepID=A0A8J6ETI9_ELECQ|nr:hypothetical protein GDO78_003381 [Eleutherodactylus coqui]
MKAWESLHCFLALPFIIKFHRYIDFCVITLWASAERGADMNEYKCCKVLRNKPCIIIIWSYDTLYRLF